MKGEGREWKGIEGKGRRENNRYRYGGEEEKGERARAGESWVME